MNVRTRALRFAVPVLLLAIAAGTDLPRAEVSVIVGEQGQLLGTLMMYREGSPPADVWKKIRPVDDRFVLNPQGDAWGDGFADLAVDPETGGPQVVWAQRSGAETEIVFAHWDGERWTSPALADDALLPTGLPWSRDRALRLSPAAGILSGPRLAIGANRMTHVVWQAGDLQPAVWIRELSLAPGEIGSAQMINDPAVPTHDPTLLVGLDRIFVGVEQEEAGLSLVVVIQATDVDRVAQRDSEPFRRRLVTLTLSVGRIGLYLYVEAGTGRARWIEGVDTLGFSDYLQVIDNWSNPYYLSTGSAGSSGP